MCYQNAKYIDAICIFNTLLSMSLVLKMTQADAKIHELSLNNISYKLFDVNILIA